MSFERPPQPSEPEPKPQPERKETIEEFNLEAGGRLYNRTKEGNQRRDIDEVRVDEKRDGGGIIFLSFTNEQGNRGRTSVTFESLLKDQKYFEIYPALDFTTLAVGSTIKSMGSGTIREIVGIQGDEKDPSTLLFALRKQGESKVGWASLQELRSMEDRIAQIQTVEERIAELEAMLQKIDTRIQERSTPLGEDDSVVLEQLKLEAELDGIRKKENEALKRKKKPRP